MTKNIGKQFTSTFEYPATKNYKGIVVPKIELKKALPKRKRMLRKKYSNNSIEHIWSALLIEKRELESQKKQHTNQSHKCIGWAIKKKELIADRNRLTKDIKWLETKLFGLLKNNTPVLIHHKVLLPYKARLIKRINMKQKQLELTEVNLKWYLQRDNHLSSRLTAISKDLKEIELIENEERTLKSKKNCI